MSGGLAARGGQRQHLAGARRAAERQHRLEDFAERSAIIFGDPATQLKQLRRQRRFVVEQLDDVADFSRGRAFSSLKHDPGQLAGPEGRQDARSRLGAFPQRRGGKWYGKRLIDGNGKSNVGKRRARSQASMHSILADHRSGNFFRAGRAQGTYRLRSEDASSFVGAHRFSYAAPQKPRVSSNPALRIPNFAG